MLIFHAALLQCIFHAAAAFRHAIRAYGHAAAIDYARYYAAIFAGADNADGYAITILIFRHVDVSRCHIDVFADILMIAAMVTVVTRYF